MADKTSSPAQKRKRGKQPKESQKSSDSSGTDPDSRTKRVKTVFEDNKDEIKEKFQMEMPQDFYDLWEFCKTLNTKRPAIALKDTLNLELVGPFDVLAGKSKEVNDESVTSYHLHWRYFYDPPEFQTVIKSCEDNQGFHIGYFRDDPKNLPVFLASNDANIGCEMTVMGDNLFAAVSIFLAETLKKCKDKSKKESLKNIQTQLSDKASELQYSLASMTPKIKSRNKSSNSKTFHRAGMVVPVDATEVGYRPLTITDGELKKILKKICESKSDSETASEKLQEIITYVQFANDECDYGMGLELGLDVFCFGEKRFENLILQLMPLAYRLLGRDLFAEIIELHVKNRHRENLNIFVKT